MTTFKLVGFISDIAGMESYIISARPVVRRDGTDYYVRSSKWTIADMTEVKESEESYINRLSELSDVTISEGEEVWLIGHNIMTSLYKAAAVLPNLNGIAEFIDSWNGYKDYRITTGSMDELHNFLAPIKQALSEEIHKEILEIDKYDFDLLQNMVHLADTLPCPNKTMEDFVRFAAFYKKADMDDNYNYMFTRTWAALSSGSFKNDAASEEHFNTLVEEYLSSN